MRFCARLLAWSSVGSDSEYSITKSCIQVAGVQEGIYIWIYNNFIPNYKCTDRGGGGHHRYTSTSSDCTPHYFQLGSKLVSPIEGYTDYVILVVEQTMHHINNLSNDGVHLRSVCIVSTVATCWQAATESH